MIKIFNIDNYLIGKRRYPTIKYYKKMYSTKSLYLDQKHINKIKNFLYLYRNFNNQYINKFSCSTTDALKIYISFERFAQSHHFIINTLKIPDKLTFTISFNYRNLFTFFNIYYLNQYNDFNYKKIIVGHNIQLENNLNIILQISESMFRFFMNNKDYLINEFFINLISSDIK